MEDYFNYILLCAFQVAVQHENKRELTLKQLHNYRIEICEQNRKYYSDNFDGFEDEEYEKRLNSFYNFNVNMTSIEEADKISLFIDKYSNFFVYNNGIVSLNDNISYENIDDERSEIFLLQDIIGKSICSKLLNFYDSLPCLDILGTTKVKEEVFEIIRVEKLIEGAYLNSQNLDEQSNIKMLSRLVSLKLNQMGNKSPIELGAYSMVIRHIYSKSNKSENSEKLSEYLIQTDKYYNANMHEINLALANKYQIAIFDRTDLTYYQLMSYIDWLWDFKEPENFPDIEFADIDAFVEKLEENEEDTGSFEDEFDEEEEFDDDYDENEEENKIARYYRNKKIEFGFYLNFIKALNNYEKLYGYNESLEKSKKRLLYLLDAYGDNLYEVENFNKLINAINASTFKKEDLEDYYSLSRLFLIDIVEGWISDEYILQKILFASTYYDLTKDRRIKRIIDKYKNTNQGEKIYNAIIKNDFSGYATNNGYSKMLSI